MKHFHLLALAVLGSAGINALENGKSSWDVNFLYETKDYYSAPEQAKKKVSRLNVTDSYKFKFNKKNTLTVQVPWASADLDSEKAGVHTKNSVSGVKDIRVSHEMVTLEPKPDRLGVKWNFRLTLPSGDEQLTVDESKVTAALGETGQGFSDPTFGKGFTMGFDTTWTKQLNKTDKFDYKFGYTLNGNYSSLEGSESYKEPGDNYIFEFSKTFQKTKNMQYVLGAGANYTMRTINHRPGGLFNANPGRMEGNLSFKMQKKKSEKLTEMVTVKFQERGEIEVQESNGQIVNTEQGDRWNLDWVFSRTQSKKVKMNYGLKATFGAANNNLDVVAPFVGTATAKIGKDTNTRMEEVQLMWGKTITINKYRKWFYQGTMGLTDDSRDYTLGSGFTFMF